MKMILSVIIGILFIFFVFVYAKGINKKYNQRMDAVAKHYGYRNYKHMAKVAKKYEEKAIREKRKEDQFKRREWLRKHGR